MVVARVNLSVPIEDYALVKEAKDKGINLSKLFTEALGTELKKPVDIQPEPTIEQKINFLRQNDDGFGNFQYEIIETILYYGIMDKYRVYKYLRDFKRYTELNPNITAGEIVRFYQEILSGFKQRVKGKLSMEEKNKILYEAMGYVNKILDGVIDGQKEK